MSATVISAIAIILIVTLLLVVALLAVKNAVTPKGSIKIDINNGKKVLEVNPGNSLMTTLANEKIFLPSACGGKANCGQCKVQVFEGGGEILPTETGFFNRKQIKEGWRLGCQVKVKNDLKIQVAESALSVKKLECEVISNKNVATFIKEFVVKLPEGEHLEFKSGEYVPPQLQGYRSRARVQEGLGQVRILQSRRKQSRAYRQGLFNGFLSRREGHHQAQRAYRHPSFRPQRA